MAHGQSGLDGQAVRLLVVQGINSDIVTVLISNVVVTVMGWNQRLSHVIQSAVL